LLIVATFPNSPIGIGPATQIHSC